MKSSAAIQKPRTICVLFLAIATWALPAFGQEVIPLPATDPAPPPATADEKAGEEDAPAAPVKVDIEPTAGDHQIEGRLLRILKATDWYTDPQVRVDEGVVFLRGRARREEHRLWAAELAQKTQDVVAVVNRMQVISPPFWDFQPAWRETESMGRNFVRSLPLTLLAFGLVTLTYFFSGQVHRLTRFIFARRLHSPLLADVGARAVTMLVFIIGLYIALRVSGLTQIAATLVGGTGLIGLIIGIAFRDIAENFLASVLISVQRPFALGDQIDIDGKRGFVQSVTMRGTLLMTLDGDHLQIPNSVVYKSTIRNYTSNPNVRVQFDLHISYESSISRTQRAILKILQEHEAILEVPEPMVLAESFENSLVIIRVYCWIDGSKHSVSKVRSALIRLIKRGLIEEGIKLPDTARERVVLQDVPVRMLSAESREAESSPADQEATATSQPTPVPTATGYPPKASEASYPDLADRQIPAEMLHEEADEDATEAEGGLESEAAEIEEQAKQSRAPDGGTNLFAQEEQSEAKLDSEEREDKEELKLK